MRDEPLAHGIGVLKLLFGTYVLIIVTIFGYSAKQHKVEENPNAIEFEMQDDFVVLSYNDKVFPVDSKSYDEFMDSDKQETLMIDTLDNNNRSFMAINDNGGISLAYNAPYDLPQLSGIFDYWANAGNVKTTARIWGAPNTTYYANYYQYVKGKGGTYNTDNGKLTYYKPYGDGDWILRCVASLGLFFTAKRTTAETGALDDADMYCGVIDDNGLCHGDYTRGTDNRNQQQYKWASTNDSEYDPTAPIGVYGLTKEKGEKAVLEETEDFYILRTAWLYGFDGKNFVYTMIRAMNTHESVKVVSDQRGSPTFCVDLANVIIKLIKKDGTIPYGIYHVTNEGETTWFDFTKEIFAQGTKKGLITNKSCIINPCTTQEYPTPAKRPSYSVLNKKKIEDALGEKLPDWQDSLALFLESKNFDHERIK